MNPIPHLIATGQAKPPSWMADNVQYLTMMGSVAYGVAGEDSDRDVYGFCIPPKETVFPHLRGEIPGFGKQIQRFDQWQQHHLADGDLTWDLSVYSIVRYFQLVMENNPNMVDSLFTPQRCVLFSTPIGEMVRERRRLFLHKGCWHKFKGYAYSQLHKLANKDNRTGKRAEAIAEHGYDLKFAYHTVRLIDEVEQILIEGDLDLERNREQLKAIRRGEWSEEQVRDYFGRKEQDLEAAYVASTLPHKPDEPVIKQLLLDCLEHHYGSLGEACPQPDRYEQVLRQVADLCHGAGL